MLVRTFRISTLREAFSHLLGLLVLGSENLSQPTVHRLSHSKPTLFKSRHLSYLICFPAHILIPLGFWCCLSLRLRVVYLNLFFCFWKFGLCQSNLLEYYINSGWSGPIYVIIYVIVYVFHLKSYYFLFENMHTKAD